MPTKEQIQAQTLYANILAEVNFRVAAINHCTTNSSGLAPPFVKDFCYLQIRMLCELTALGCLVAHGDIKQTKASALQKAWSADKIMATLEELHPHFFPLAIKQTKTEKGFHLEAIDPKPLTKDELLDLYHRCGEQLHRGNLRKLLKGQFPTQIDYPEITGKAQKIINLLSNHLIVMHTGEQLFLAMLQNKDDNLKPQVAITETPKGQRVDFASPAFLKEAL